MAGRPWTLVTSDLPPARREFALALRTLLAKVGAPSLAALARQTDLAPSTISRYLSGKTLPSSGSLLELVQALSTDMAEIGQLQELWEQAMTEVGATPSAPWAGSSAPSGARPWGEEAMEARDLFATLRREANLSVREIARRMEPQDGSVPTVSKSSVDRALRDPAGAPLALALQVADVLIDQLPEPRRESTRVTVQRLLTDAHGAERESIPVIVSNQAATAPAARADHLRNYGDVQRTGSRGSGSAARRLLLGARLRRLRVEHGITRLSAGLSIRSSEARIFRLENGQTRIKPRDVESLLTLYGVVDEDERAEFLELVDEANSSPWWHSYADLIPSWFQTYLSLEGSASLICSFETHWVHGLLQTEAYATALAKSRMADLPQADLERYVTLRLERQRYLTGADALDLHVVLDEATLRRSPGDKKIMRGQLQHLIEISKRPNVRLQIMPFSAIATSATGAFTILSFPGIDLGEIVYVENLTNALYLERSEDVYKYKEFMKELQSKALSPADSRDVITGLIQLKYNQ